MDMRTQKLGHMLHKTFTELLALLLTAVVAIGTTGCTGTAGSSPVSTGAAANTETAANMGNTGSTGSTGNTEVAPEITDSGETSEGLNKYTITYLDVFDTVTTLTGWTKDEAAFAAEAGEIHDELLNYHKLYDIYNVYDGMVNLKQVNDAAGGTPVAVGSEIMDLLAWGQQVYTLTGGAVNIAMGAVLTIWHEYREAGIADPSRAELPPMDELKEASAHTDITKMQLDTRAGTVTLTDAQMKLDVGALAKGYATEKVCEAARARGWTHLLVNVGGNVEAVGDKPGGIPWAVGVQNPDNVDDYLKVVNDTDLSVVTSGNYQRYYEVNGVRYHHIIDPKTLMPSEYWDSVTIICADSSLADALSTALFLMDQESGQKLLDSAGKAAEAMWIKDGTITYSSGFAAYLKDT